MSTAAKRPAARRDAVVDRLHGREVPDPYRWLEDADDPGCAAWLDEQAETFARHTGTWTGRDAWRARLAEAAGGGGAAVPTASPPVWRHGRRFFLRRTPDMQLPVLMTAGPDGPPRVLLDPLALDASGTTTLGYWRPSPDGGLLAYQVTRRGDERPLLWVLDVAAGGLIDGPLEPGRPTPVAWLAGGTAFCYIDTPGPGLEAGRRLRLHRVGTDPAADPVLFHTDHPQLSVTTAPDGRRLMLSAAPGATSGNLLWLARAPDERAPDLRPELVHDGTADGTRAVLKFAPDGRVLAVTDRDAPFGRLCAVDPADPRAEGWRTVIAEEPGVVLADCAALTDPGTGEARLLTVRTRHGASELRLHAPDGTALRDVPVPGHGTVARLTVPPDGGPRAWFVYTDYTTPPAVHRVDIDEGSCVPEAPPVPEPPPVPEARPGPEARPISRGAAARAGVRARPDVRRLTYASADGTRVRMHLIAPPGGSGPRPLVLSAYGGFGASTPPAYSPAVAAWVEAGGAYAVASVRGGGEEGTGWHAAGRGRNKPNAVDDFTAAARALIDGGHTSPDRLAIRGASHSGLLVAAAVTRRPELYAAAVISDAVTDMVRYHRFGVGRLWTEEFGTADDPEHFAVLLGYSPYHRVRPGTGYPAVLLTCPRHDPRVDSMHTRKMTAALQHATASSRPVLLRCESGVGHGERSLSRWLGLQTDVLAFCAAHTGLRLP
ncbi:prolyl oligopeptidase family protein [Actinomadura sp. WMMB 499]|uniref:prolyl oligopeptidase family serine peptidase n=1 Tax=Actinomadura sp. WMMB 499 TaxID=1219491 RepID=UPI001247586A|nr:prolyl oligopeptidase family serine peptidase [Actinomadura sp. WMMB 499]QFG26372.1 S9 family peptidase [Actinomadura sp. WMMB 499]